MEDLPKTPSGKLQKFKLRETAKVFGRAGMSDTPAVIQLELQGRVGPDPHPPPRGQ